MGLSEENNGRAIRFKLAKMASDLDGVLNQLLIMRLFPSLMSVTGLITNISRLVFWTEYIWGSTGISTENSRFHKKAKSMLNSLSLGEKSNLGSAFEVLRDILPEYTKIDMGHPKCKDFSDDFWFSSAFLPIPMQVENGLNFEDRNIVSSLPTGALFNIGDTQGSQPESDHEKPTCSHKVTTAEERTYSAFKNKLSQEEKSFLEVADETTNNDARFMPFGDDEEEEDMDLFNF